MRGIKLFPSITGFSLEDPSVAPLFEYCEEKKLPVILANELWNRVDRWPHTTDYSTYCEILSRLIDKYSGIKWLLCHLGCFNWSENPGEYLAAKEEVFKHFKEFARLMDHENVWTDIAAIAWYYDEPYPYPTALKLIGRVVGEIGVEKVLFGTDWPWSDRYCTYKQMVDMIRCADFLSCDQRKRILGENAMDFLGSG